jgi:hypothetical protein
MMNLIALVLVEILVLIVIVVLVSILVWLACSSRIENNNMKPHFYS